MATKKQVHIIGGGTVSHVRNHLALCAPAYGTTGIRLAQLFCRELAEQPTYGEEVNTKMDVNLHLTRMALGAVVRETHGDGRCLPYEVNLEDNIETNNDVKSLVDRLVANPLTKIVVMNAALCDFNGEVHGRARGIGGLAGKYGDRLDSSNVYGIAMVPAEKIVGNIRKERKDIFLVAFKTTCGASPDEQYAAGLRLCKEASCNLVLANDTKTRINMVVTPEEARYHVTDDREEALRGLVEMAVLRSHLTFTRSTVVAGEPVPWTSKEVPSALRIVVNHCIGSNAYKPFRGATVGHFACKLSDNEFLTSIRRTNFNELNKTGLVRIKTDGPDSVIAYGSKPSVGGQSQRIVFHDHREYDCIVHFHCPLKEGHRDDVPVRSQREVECGSHQCGKNTSDGLRKFGNLSAVMLDQHGPNIVFNRSIDPLEVIGFIEANFDLSAKTGGYVRGFPWEHARHPDEVAKA